MSYKQVEIPVLPLATISISPNGEFFAEIVVVDETGKPGTLQLAARNLNSLLTNLRPKLQKNKEYFIEVANNSFQDLKAKRDAAAKLEEATAPIEE